MNPGLYIIRRKLGGKFLILQSRPLDPSIADSWGEFIKDSHPKDRVFLIEVKHEIRTENDHSDLPVRSG